MDQVKQLRRFAEIYDRAGTTWLGSVTPAAAFSQAADSIERLRAALQPFADCNAQIADTEPDEEWAKFRLLVKNYRLAHGVLAGD